MFAANLQAAGYQPLCFDDPKQTLASLQRDDPPDAYVLDWDMPCLDGLALFRLLRARGAAVPVLFLQPIFEEAALDAGAVDFVDKSRGPAIVLHRLSLALTRRDASAALPSGTDRANLQIGELLLSDLTKRATWRGRHVRLSRNEFDVVALLADNAGRDVGYRQIYDVVCGNGCVAGTARTATAPTYARWSSGSGANSSSSIRILQHCRIIPALAIAGPAWVTRSAGEAAVHFDDSKQALGRLKRDTPLDAYVLDSNMRSDALMLQAIYRAQSHDRRVAVTERGARCDSS